MLDSVPNVESILNNKEELSMLKLNPVVKIHNLLLNSTIIIAASDWVKMLTIIIVKC